MKSLLSGVLFHYLFMGTAKGDAPETCQRAMINSLFNGSVLARVGEYSGKQLNDIGRFRECGTDGRQHGLSYSLQLITDTIGKPQEQYVIGTCMLQQCGQDDLDAIDSIFYQSAYKNFMTKTAPSIVTPSQQDALVNNLSGGYTIMLVVFLITCAFSLFGILIQYSNIGNVTEKNKVVPITFPQNAANSAKQLEEILLQKDKFLIHKKKIWALFFLCFSPTRNALILFYDLEKSRKVGFLRMVKVIAFFWLTFSVTYYWGFISFPINFNEYPHIISSWQSTLLLAGVIFGYDLFLFSTAFQITFEKLQSIYLHKMPFHPILFIVKSYLQYVIPVCMIMAIMICFYPFLSTDSPLYSYFTMLTYNNCASYWYTNVLFIQNLYPWDTQQTCLPHLFIIATEFQLLAIFIPVFLTIYRITYRKVLLGSFVVVSFFGGIFPTFYLTYVRDINFYPGFIKGGYIDLYTRPWFRVNPFLFGIALAIIKFEYKYVEKLNCGGRPLHKTLLDKIRQSRFKQWALYLSGLILVLFPVLILLADTLCYKDMFWFENTGQMNLNCTNQLSNSFYNSLAQFVFFAGVILMLTPPFLNVSRKLRPLMSSHIWHVLEELTFSAFLLSALITQWYRFTKSHSSPFRFFTSRQTNSQLSVKMLFNVALSVCCISYIGALPFYLLIERPFTNFLNLILFPKGVKLKDAEEDESEEEELIGEDSGPKGAGEDETEILTKKTVINRLQKKSQIKGVKCSSCEDSIFNVSCDCNCFNTGFRCKCQNKKASQIGNGGGAAKKGGDSSDENNQSFFNPNTSTKLTLGSEFFEGIPSRVRKDSDLTKRVSFNIKKD